MTTRHAQLLSAGRWGLCTALVLLLIACRGPQGRCPALPDPEVRAGPGRVAVSGSWIDDPNNKRSIAAYRINTVDLQCVQASLRCTEAVAFLSQWPQHDIMGVIQREWRVTEWGDAKVIAEGDFPKTKAKLSIDLQAKRASFVVQDPDALMARLGSSEEACRAGAPVAH